MNEKTPLVKNINTDEKDEISKRKSFLYYIPIYVYSVFVITLGSFEYGYQLGVLNNSKESLTKCGYNRGFFKSCIPMNTIQWSAVSSLFTLGGCFGSLLIFDVSRKQMIYFSSTIMIFSSFLMTFFSHWFILSVGRFIMGFATGVSATIVSIYIGEISPVSLRGSFGAVNQLVIVIAINISQILGVFLVNQFWRVLLAISVVPPLLCMILLPFCPESPRWLMLKGREKECLESLTRLNLQDEFESIKSSNQPKNETFPALKPLFIAIALQIFQQFSGPNIINFYSTEILVEAGIKGAIYATVLLGGVKVLSTIANIFVIEKFGRRFCMLSGMIVQILSFIGLIISLFYSGDVFKFLSVIFLITYNLGFNFGLGPIPRLMIPELLPTHQRSKASSIASTINFFSAFLVTFTFPTINFYLGKYTFIVYTVLTFLFLVITYFFVPETKGKTIEELTNG